MSNNKHLIQPNDDTKAYYKTLDPFSIGCNLKFDLNDYKKQKTICIIEIRNDNFYKDGNLDYTGVKNIWYQLYLNKQLNIVDLGVISNTQDIESVVDDVIGKLPLQDIKLIVLGGTNELMYNVYKTYSQIKNNLNIGVITDRFNFGSNELALNPSNYLSKIILKQPNNLKKYTNFGYQPYFVAKEELDLINELGYNAYDLEKISTQLLENNIFFEDIDIINIDLNTIQYADYSCGTRNNTIGFNAKEICKLAKYSGQSNKTRIVSVLNYDESLDHSGLGAMLTAQIVWNIING